MKILGLLLSLLSSIAGYFREKQLLDAGETKEKARVLDETLEANRRADAARRSVDNNVIGLFDDPNRRR